MKNIGYRMQNLGQDVEYLHCASDPDSLDGILIPALRVALLDGTAPHVIDPINPGAVDEIINLGEYWNPEGIKQKKEEIIRVNTETGRLFKRAYHYLAAAKCLSDSVVELLDAATDKAGLYFEADRIIQNEFFGKPVGRRMGKVKKQFASAITPLGIVQYIDTLFDETYRTYLIKNRRGVGVAELLERISKEAQIRGIDTELYYCPMVPALKIEHLIIPELALAYISENEYFAVNSKYEEEIDIARYTGMSCLASGKEAMAFGVKGFDMLLNEAIQTLHEAKSLHDDMEKYYIPHMHFEQLKEKTEDVIKRILSYA
ncbi:MAG: hypothetical protein ACYCX2_04205 [Christensenellales bacterium]